MKRNFNDFFKTLLNCKDLFHKLLSQIEARRKKEEHEEAKLREQDSAHKVNVRLFPS